MSKTYSDQIVKARAIVAGVRSNLSKMEPFGITADQLNRLEEALNEGERLNNEVEEMRAATSAKVKEANKVLVALKEQALEIKRTVKTNVDIMQWPDFGVQDKR